MTTFSIRGPNLPFFNNGFGYYYVTCCENVYCEIPFELDENRTGQLTKQEAKQRAQFLAELLNATEKICNLHN